MQGLHIKGRRPSGCPSYLLPATFQLLVEVEEKKIKEGFGKGHIGQGLFESSMEKGICELLYGIMNFLLTPDQP